MKRFFLVAIGILMCCVCVAGRKVGHGKKAVAKGQLKKQQAVVFKEHDNHVLAVFVLQQLDAGVKGEPLALAIRAKLGEIKAARAAGKDIESGEELKAFKHGLEKEDLNGLGAFVAAKHGEGLKGDDLSKAVTAEAKNRHEYRKQMRVKAAKGKAQGKGKK